MQSLLCNGVYNFAGGQTGVYRSTDTSANYTKYNSGNDSIGPTRGFTKDNDFVYTCTSKGVYRSDDNGTTWVSKSNGLTNLLTSGIISIDSFLFVVGSTGIFKSSDQGDNWNSAGLSTTDVRCIAFIQDTLFVGTNGSGIYKSIDWGANWISINNGLGGSTNFRAIESKGNLLFAGGQVGSGVFRSTDFGASWNLLSGGLSSGSYRGFASNNQLIVAGSFGGGVFYSKDNGNNWTAINVGLSDLTIFDLEINNAYIVAATNTQGVFRFALSNLNLSTGIENCLNDFEIQLFPNPVTNQLNIKSNKRLVGAFYSIYDKTGKSILTGKIYSENSIIDVRNLSSGIYLLNIDGNTKQPIKIIKE